ncbi:MAG: HAD family phosphatase [Actinobacteria bacterium]|nr:HAD family phosphatase [Actinomycetota bacterium]
MPQPLATQPEATQPDSTQPDATQPAALDAVFFDFGGIFMDSPFAALNQASEDFGVDPVLMLSTLFGSYDEDTDHPWHQLERGELTLDVAISEISAISEANGLGHINLFEALGGMMSDPSDRTFMVDLVKDLRAAGVKTSIITNNLKEFGSVWRSVIPVDELFDDVVDSCEVGMRKPSPAIYHLAMERVGVSAERSAFIDDYEGNVIAARQIGMAGVWSGYSNASTRAAAAELRALAGLH